MEACSLCLEVDATLSSFGDSEASKHLQNIFRSHGFQAPKPESLVCSICKHLCNKYFLFIKRILRAQSILGDLEKKNKEKYLYLKYLDRSRYNLNLNLSCHNILNYYYGVTIIDDNMKFEYTSNSETEVSIAELQKLKKQSKIYYELKIQDTTKDIKEEFNSDNEKENDQEDIEFHTVLSQRKINKPRAKRFKYKPTPVELMPSKLRSKKKKPKILLSDNEESEGEAVVNNNSKKKKRRNSDEDFIPKQTDTESESEESSESEIYYDDNGKRMKKEDNRKYPMECQECDAEIQSAAAHWQHHLLYHRDKKYPFSSESVFVCKYCGITKTTIGHLRNHEDTHGPKKSKCNQCGKKFFNKEYLRKHAICHNKKYAYICDYCNKGFHFRGDITLHIRIHTGDKPFKCHICGAAFAHKGNVGIHIRTNHQNAKQKSEKKIKNKSAKKKPNRKKK